MSLSPGNADQQEQRFNEVVAAYLEAVDAGTTPDQAEWLARFPEFAAPLREFFAAREHIDRFGIALRAPPPPEISPGSVRQFGDYELLAKLGQGGMGVIYKARHKRLNRLVALKMLRANLLESGLDLSRFRTESEATALLDHPHIVPIYDVGEHDGQPYFSMKLIEGGSLAEAIVGAPEAVLSNAASRRAAQWVATVARAVHHAHQRGVLHRDLKPSNILLDAEGRPHVTDFGLAKRVAVDSGLTQSGAIVGTPGYMAPEQAAGRKGVLTTATDVYGLGAVLYGLLTGRPPFHGDTVLETLEQVKELEPTPPGATNAKVDHDLQTICLKCLEKDPRQRYGSAEAVAEDLERWLAGAPIWARPVGLLERGWRWCRRNPALAAVSSLATVALLATTVVSVLFAVRERQNAQNLGEALRGSEANRRQAEQNQRQAEHRLAENYLDQGLALCERQEIAAGLLWLVRALEQAPVEAADLRRVLRANLAAWSRRLHRLRALLEHQGPVLAATFSADGRTLLTGSEDGTVRLWEAATGKPLGRVFAHAGGVRALALNPDGRLLVTVSVNAKDRSLHPGYGYTAVGQAMYAGGTIRFWETTTGQPLGPPLPQWGWVCALAFSPDGRTLVTGSVDKTARLWDTSSRTPLSQPLAHAGIVWAVAFNPDGKTVLTADWTDTPVRLWEAATGQPSGLPIPSSKTCAAVFSPDGRTVLTGNTENKAQLWDVASGQALGSPLQHQGLVMAMAFCPDGQTVVTGSYDKTARCWETSTRQPLGQPLLHQNFVQAVAVRPDGRAFVTGSWDGTARLWEMAPQERQSPWLHYQGFVKSMAFSPDHRLILTGSEDKTARLWEAATGKPVGKALSHPEFVEFVAFGSDGQTILTATASGQIRLWEAATGKLVEEVIPDRRSLVVALSPDGRFLWGGRDDGMIWLGKMGTGEAIDKVSWLPDNISCAAFSHDGRFLLAGSSDKTARLWDLALREPIGEALEHSDGVYAVAFSPDEQALMTATPDGSFRRWERATGKPLGPPFQLQGERGGVSSFGADGTTVLTVYADGKARLRDVATGKCIGPPVSHQGRPRSLAFSPETRSIVTLASKTATARWEVPPPVPDEVERLRCWIQTLTGVELDQAGRVQVLDAATWRQRRQRLDELGGPPGMAMTTKGD